MIVGGVKYSSWIPESSALLDNWCVWNVCAVMELDVAGLRKSSLGWAAGVFVGHATASLPLIAFIVCFGRSLLHAKHSADGIFVCNGTCLLVQS